jgi:hypothetical protein
VFVFLKDIPMFECLKKLVILHLFALQYVKIDQGFFLFLSLVCSWLVFCVAFVSSDYVKGLVRSYYFLQLVVFMSILFAYSLVIMGKSAFW